MSDNKFDRYLSTHFSALGGDKRNLRRLESLRANYVRLLPRDRTAAILDVGPGMGELLQLLVHEGGYSNVEAIDLSAEVSEYCSRLFCRTIQVEDPTQFLNARSERYQLITLLHVLEHVEKPKILAFLQALRSALVPGGRLVVEVPNMGNPFVGLTYRYGDFTHEVGFTERSLAQVLQMAGFADPAVLPFRVPLTSASRIAQYAMRKCAEGFASLVAALYTSDVELNSANLVAVVERQPD